MGNTALVALLLLLLITRVTSIQVIVPETTRSTTLFASVILRCDYSTSANPQDVLVTWRYKSFCKDPVLEYYSTAYQAALQLSQDPANDCPDRQRTVRTVAQKRGINEPILGAEYQNRKITIQNKADLVINEVMWWDNGVYYCSIDAPGDTTGDSDREIKLIVYHWLTVLLIILGALLLIILLCVCCCQCCPQKCCCYVRCPCCPKTCCCPEKVVMQHRMLKEAQKSMVPWMHSQHAYAPIHTSVSPHGVPMLYTGSYSEPSVKENFSMAPMHLAPLPVMQQPAFAPTHRNSSMRSSKQGANQVLDYLENQVMGLDVGLPQVAPHPVHTLAPLHPQPHRVQPPVPFAPGPPSMLSALDEIGVRGMERRVITLPPIIQRAGGAEGARIGPRISSQSSGSTNRSAGSRHHNSRGYRDNSPPLRGILRDYGDDLEWDRRGRGSHSGSRNERGGSARRRGEESRPRSRSRDNLMGELRGRMTQRQRSYSPPVRHGGSWSSDEEDSWRAKGGKGRGWPEKPPSYSAINIEPGGQGNSRRNYDRFSDKSSHSSTTVVI